MAFPAWSQEAGWRAAGERSTRSRDAAPPRSTTTVRRGPPLLHDRRRTGARLARRRAAGRAAGVEIRLLRSDRAVVATWRVAGHQCVLSAPAAVSDEAVLALAARAGESATEGPAPAYGAATAPPG